MTEHGLHAGCVPGKYQAILISRAPMHIYIYIYAHNCAQKKSRKTPAKIRKVPAKTRKRPQIQESGKFE